MKLTKTKEAVKITRDFPGLLKAEFNHVIKETRGSCVFTGPRIPEVEWHAILSFFRWTSKTSHSESQVRLYVNMKENTWTSWAYPQEARSGMSAREVNNDDAKKQREQFKETDGWVYFGTVHHHCSGGAFQSGTDEANERDQDGLHITVGMMASPRHDMHCRFYLGGYCFDPDMSDFWDIGKDMARLLPSDMHDRIARHQMCDVIEVGYPKQWEQNLIEVKWERGDFSHNKSDGLATAGFYSGYGGTGAPSKHNRDQPPWVRARRAVQALCKEANDSGIHPDGIEKLVGELNSDPWCKSIIDQCVGEGVEIGDLWTAFPVQGMDQEPDQKQGRHKPGKQVGAPPKEINDKANPYDREAGFSTE